jgi:hypothetical protein
MAVTASRAQGLEGIVAKRRDRPYQSGRIAGLGEDQETKCARCD